MQLVHHLNIIFLCLSTLILGVISQVNVRMIPAKFHTIALRGSFEELNSIVPTSQRANIWITQSKEYFRSRKSCNSLDTKPCTLPYILCESSPGLSGYRRRERIIDIISAETPLRRTHLAKVDDSPMYNSMEKTCFVVSITPNTARKISSTTCANEDSMCIMQPLMPMLKIAQGTLESITQISENDDIPVISIKAELSPYFKGKEEDIALDNIASHVIKASSSDADCQWQVKDSFPSTGKSIDCQQSIDEMVIDVDWDGENIALFNIQKNEEDSSQMHRDKALRFISGLAVRGEVSIVEGGSDSYYYVYY